MNKPPTVYNTHLLHQRTEPSGICNILTMVEKSNSKSKSYSILRNGSALVCVCVNFGTQKKFLSQILPI